LTDSKPQIILFDVYGTLAEFDPPREQIQMRAGATFGLELDRDGLNRGYRDADHFMAMQNASAPVRLMPLEVRTQFFARYEQIVLSGAGEEVDLELAGKVWNSVRSQEYGWALFTDVLPGFERLRSAGFRVAALSNMPFGEQEMCEMLGLTGQVEFAVTSGDVGVEKPDPRIFRTALQRAGVDAADAMMVGDSITSDLRSAEAVGMRAVLMDRYGNHQQHEEHARVTNVYGVLGLVAD
jgi:HAD superfamily hydrolase (TIGR01549 family)